MDEPNLQDDAGNDADEYRVAPLPQSYDDPEKSPAYHPVPLPTPRDTYSLGPEVDAGDYSVGSESWREAAAGVQRPTDEFSSHRRRTVIARG